MDKTNKNVSSKEKISKKKRSGSRNSSNSSIKIVMHGSEGLKRKVKPLRISNNLETK